MRLTWMLTMVVVLAGAYATYQTALNHDNASYLLMARALVDGRALYESFPDYSMPANAWLALLSLRIATATGLLLAPVHQGVMFALTAAAGGLAGHIVSRTVGSLSLTGRVLPPLIMGLFLFVPGYDAGQRDVMFGVLAAPLVAVVAARHVGFTPGRGLSLAIVVLAAIGSSLKPQVGLPLLVLGACELALCRLRPRRVAPELWWLAAVLVCYVVAVQVMYPTYFRHVLPGAAKFYVFQRAWIVSVIQNLAVSMIVAAAAAALLAAVLLDRRASGLAIRWGLVVAWAAFGTSLAAMYLVQRMGAHYQSVPVLLFVLVSLALFALMGIEASRRRWAAGGRWLPGAWGLAACAVPLACVALAVLSYLPAGTARADVTGDRITQLLRALPPGTYVLAFQSGVPPMSPLHAYADIRWSGEFSTSNEISAIVLDEAQARAQHRPRDPELVAMEQRSRAAIVRSLTVHPPQIVLVDVTIPLRWFERHDPPFKLLPWLEQDPAFVAAWANYQYVETDPSFAGVTVQVWRRRANL